MQQQISFLTIGVQDLAGMKNFYQHVFGWKPMKDEAGIAFYKMNGFILGLYPEEMLADDIGVLQDGNGFKRVTMAMNFDSETAVDEAFSTLVAKGAIIIKSPEKVYWGGYRGYISDIEQNYWELAYNPFLTGNELID